MWLISNKIKVAESGLLEGYCDYHCHLLPGVDDGVKKEEETMRILERWESVGVKEVWMTPHIMEDIPNKPAELKERFEKVKAHYNGSIELHLAAEHMMDNLFLERLPERGLLTLGITGSRLLVETSYYNPPMDMGGIIESIKMKGYEPVLAHPERYQYMDMRDYKAWKAKGVRLQLNIGSLVCAYGPEVQKKAEMLLDRGMYDLWGTDTHSMRFVEYVLESRMKKKVVKKVMELMERG